MGIIEGPHDVWRRTVRAHENEIVQDISIFGEGVKCRASLIRFLLECCSFFLDQPFRDLSALPVEIMGSLGCLSKEQ
jgi:hypothetical protein